MDRGWLEIHDEGLLNFYTFTGDSLEKLGIWRVDKGLKDGWVLSIGKYQNSINTWA